MPVFGPGLLMCAAWVPIFCPKYGLQAVQLFVSASLRPVTLELERFHECLLSGASAEMRQDQCTQFKKNEVQQQADMRPRRRGGSIAERWQGPKRGIAFRRQDQTLLELCERGFQTWGIGMSLTCLEAGTGHGMLRLVIFVHVDLDLVDGGARLGTGSLPFLFGLTQCTVTSSRVILVWFCPR